MAFLVREAVGVLPTWTWQLLVTRMVTKDVGLLTAAQDLVQMKESLLWCLVPNILGRYLIYPVFRSLLPAPDSCISPCWRMDDVDTGQVEYGDLSNCSPEQVTAWGISAAESVSFALGMDKDLLRHYLSQYPFGHFNDWLSSVLTTICIYPLYIIRARLIAAGPGHPTPFHDLLQMGTQINQEEGYKGFFRGLGFQLAVLTGIHLARFVGRRILLQTSRKVLATRRAPRDILLSYSSARNFGLYVDMLAPFLVHPLQVWSLRARVQEAATPLLLLHRGIFLSLFLAGSF